MMELRRLELEAEILDPERGFQPVRLPLEIRWDPLTGHSSRLLRGAQLLKRSNFDLEELAASTRSGCPFCADRIDSATPKLPPAVSAQGRMRRGDAVLFPNLLPYSKHSSVSVYSPSLHFLPLAQMTPRLVGDNLATQVEFARAVIAADPDAQWTSVNANHMLPSGSSVFHPHLQGSVNPEPTTIQRLLAETPAERFSAYVETEKQLGERHVAASARVEWLASFAPIAPAEFRAFVPDVVSIADADDDLVDELGTGIATILNLYAELGFESFNLAIYGAPSTLRDYPLNLRLACRSNLEPLYRSDATWLERLHWEAAVDVAPEELAERARPRFD